MSVFNQIKCELDAPDPAQQVNLSREVAIEVCLQYDRLRAINAELLAALKALHLAFYSVPFKPAPRQMPALKAASEMANAAVAAAEKG